MHHFGSAAREGVQRSKDRCWKCVFKVNGVSPAEVGWCETLHVVGQTDWLACLKAGPGLSADTNNPAERSFLYFANICFQVPMSIRYWISGLSTKVKMSKVYFKIKIIIKI